MIKKKKEKEGHLFYIINTNYQISSSGFIS